MTRIEHFNGSDAPPANSLIPAASTIVVDDEGRILLHRRSDNNLWALPGGAMEVGENIAGTAIRETKEETGFDVAIDRLVGIYSHPHHVVEFSDGEVRQQFSVCFACKIIGGELRPSEESFSGAFFHPEQIDGLNVHESIRLRIRHYVERRMEPFIG